MLNENGEGRTYSLSELLDMAFKKEPKSYDSQGREYFIGPTIGILVTWWCDANSGIFNKILKDIKLGLSDEEIMEKYKKSASGFTKYHLSWAKDRIKKDEYNKKHWKENISYMKRYRDMK